MRATFSSAVLCALVAASCGGSTSGVSGTGSGGGSSSGADSNVGTGGSGGATASGGRVGSSGAMANGGAATGGTPNGSGGAQSVIEAGISSDSATTGSDSGASDAASDGSTCPPGQSDASTAACVPGSLSLISANACGSPRATASRVIAGMRAGFRNCYNRALTQNPGVYGEITLFIRVAPDGSVSGVASRYEGNLPDSVIGCMKARASAAQFDPGTGPTTLVITLAAGCAPAGDAMP